MITLLTSLTLLAALHPIPRVSPGEIRIDAFFDEWAGQPALNPTAATISGRVKDARDLSGTIQVTHDGTWLYIAAQIKDDVFQSTWDTGKGPGGDRLLFNLGTSRKKKQRTPDWEIQLNDLEAPDPAVILRRGRPYKGGQIFSTTRVDGWAVELKIPLTAVPDLAGGPAQLVFVIHDVDHDNTRTEAVVATAPTGARQRATAPTVTLDLADGLEQAYAADQGVDLPTLKRLSGDLTGDKLPEQILINSRDIVVMGQGLPDQAAYLFFSHGWMPNAELVRAELMPLDATRGAELVITHREGDAAGEWQREVISVYGLHEGYLKRRFSHQLAEIWPPEKQAMRATFKASKRKGRKPRSLIISAAKGEGGLTPGVWQKLKLTEHGAYEPLDPPWARKKPLVFTLQGEQWERR